MTSNPDLLARLKVFNQTYPAGEIELESTKSLGDGYSATIAYTCYHNHNQRRSLRGEGPTRIATIDACLDTVLTNCKIMPGDKPEEPRPNVNHIDRLVYWVKGWKEPRHTRAEWIAIMKAESELDG